MRLSYDFSRVNTPKTIAGIEWKLVVAVGMFFGFAAIMFKAPAVLVAPVIIIAFLRGPALRDSDFLNIYKKHTHQRDFYSPAYIAKKNFKNPRPVGFSRLEDV